MTPFAFLTLAAIHAVAVMSPGPTFVVQLRTAVNYGQATAFLTALGFGIGAAIWGGAALLGLAALFQVAPAALTALKVLGGLFLAYIGITMWRHSKEPFQMDAGVQDRQQPSALASLRLGILTSLSNPKVVIFFGAVFVGLIPATATLLDFSIIVALVLVVETTWYAAIGFAFATPPARRAYGQAKTWVDRSFGGILAAMGLKIMTT